MSVLRITLFGKFCVRCGQQPLVGLDASKAKELLCYLLLHRDRPHPREGLAALLWEGCSTVQSKRYLRKALWQLQATLNDHPEHSSDCVLLVEPDWVQLNPKAPLWLDVAEFEQAFHSFQRLPGDKLDLREVETLCGAVDLYRGDLLEGWYQDWCLYERERLQHMYLAMLDKLMGFCEAHEKYEIGLACGVRILRYDRARERTHRRLMRLYYLAGDRTAALRQYERCATILKDELGVQPARSTVALCEQIRADRLDGAALQLTEARASSGIAAAEGTTGCLKTIQKILVDLQHHTQQALKIIEMAVSGRHEV